MSAASKVCSLCLRPTEECGIVAGNVMDIYVCGSCAVDVLETIRLEEEARAAAEAPATVEKQAFDALKRAEQFIVNGIEHGFIKVPGLDDPAQETLPAIRSAIERMQEVSAA